MYECEGTEISIICMDSRKRNIIFAVDSSMYVSFSMI
jgi:hypothetical protein